MTWALDGWLIFCIDFRAHTYFPFCIGSIFSDTRVGRWWNSQRNRMFVNSFRIYIFVWGLLNCFNQFNMDQVKQNRVFFAVFHSFTCSTLSVESISKYFEEFPSNWHYIGTFWTISSVSLHLKGTSISDWRVNSLKKYQPHTNKQRNYSTGSICSNWLKWPRLSHKRTNRNICMVNVNNLIIVICRSNFSVCLCIWI